PFLRSSHKAEAEKPLEQWDMRAMEDRANPHRELAAAVHTMMPAAAFRLRRGRGWPYAVKAAAVGAIRSVRPTDCFQLRPGSLFIVVARVVGFDGKLHGRSP